MDPFLGELRLVGFTFPPRGWANCDGQLISIQQNTALFALLGTTYGGNGTTTFALPDLRGRVPMHHGQGAGLSPHSQGEVAGTETVTLIGTQMPPHTHAISAASTADSKNPNGKFPAVTSAGSSYGSNPNLVMAPQMAAPAGGGQPHNNMQPYLALKWIIAMEGIFPSRN